MKNKLKELRELNLKETKEKLKKIPEDKKLIKKYKQKDLSYKKIIKRIAQNLTDTLGEELAAELIAKAGSLKKLAFMASSKIQVIGAESALFKHLKEGTKPPKYGIIFKHISIQKAKNKGKAARQLASKISLAAKKDYFKKSVC
ncbi:MAG: hypothetical protein ISS23_01155 [Nanoarchaeota archaeon]|nr:hypothetical protein [Nanoarchaeota archaeon]